MYSSDWKRENISPAHPHTELNHCSSSILEVSDYHLSQIIHWKLFFNRIKFVNTTTSFGGKIHSIWEHGNWHFLITWVNLWGTALSEHFPLVHVDFNSGLAMFHLIKNLNPWICPSFIPSPPLPLPLSCLCGIRGSESTGHSKNPTDPLALNPLQLIHLYIFNYISWGWGTSGQ